MSEEPIDILAIQDEAERIAREEYMDAHRALKAREEIVNTRETKWRHILLMLSMDSTVTPSGQTIKEESLDDVLEKIRHEIQEFHKLDKMFKLINGNPLLKSQWDKLVMSIRLVGGDSND